MTSARTEWARLHSWWVPSHPFEDDAGWSLRRQAAAHIPEPLSLIGPDFTYLVVDGQDAGLRGVRYRLRVERVAKGRVNSIEEAYWLAVGLGMDRTRRWWHANPYNQRKSRSPMPLYFTVWTIGKSVPITDREPLPADLHFNRNTGWIELPVVS